MAIIQNPTPSGTSPNDTTVAAIQVSIPNASLGNSAYLYLDITITGDHSSPPIFHYLITLPDGSQIDSSGPIKKNGINIGLGSALAEASTAGNYLDIQFSVTKVNKGETVTIGYHFWDLTTEFLTPPDSITGLNPNAGTEWIDTGVKFIN